MIKGLDWKLSFIITIDDWFNDFLNIVNVITPTWTTVYKLNKLKEIKNGILIYQILINDFHKKAKTIKLSTKSKITKRSFDPIFTGKDTDHTDMSNSDTERQDKK